MGDLGAGLRLYVKGGIFVRPELRHAERLGVSLGYTFGER